MRDPVGVQRGLVVPIRPSCSHRLRRILRLAWFAGVLLVIVGSLLPGNSVPIRALASLDISDKIEHFAAYAVLAFIPAIHEPRRTTVIVALALVALGILLEFGQLLSATRDFEVGDMVADAAGVAGGVLGAWPLRRSVNKHLLV